MPIDRSAALLMNAGCFVAGALLHAGGAPETLMRQSPPLTLQVQRVSAEGVEVTWRRVPGAMGYALYRFTPSIPGPVRLADRLIVATHFCDRLRTGVPARYQLVAFLTDGRTFRSRIRSISPRALPVSPDSTASPATACAFDPPVILP